MTTRKYFSLAALGIGLVLASFAITSSRTHAPVLSVPERVPASAPSPARTGNAVKALTGSATPAPSSTPASSVQSVPDDSLHASFAIGERTYDLRFREGETLYQAMRRLEQAGAIAIEGKNFSGLGFFVEGLNGERNGRGNYWIYSVNGVKASVGVEGYRPKAGDRIVWTFEETYE